MKRLLLAGAGHAHALVLRALRERPIEDASICMVAPAPAQTYSGMVPGHLAGHYAREEITIDAARLCERAGCEFIPGAVAMLDPGRRLVRLEDGRQLAYDFLSLNVGSLTAAGLPGAEHALAVKPMDRFIREVRLAAGTRTAIVGGGVAGAELAMALAYRGVAVSLFAERALDRRLGAALRENAVAMHAGAPVARIEPGPKVRTKDATAAFDQVILATGAAPLPWLRSASLALDDAGFALVDRTLRSVSHPEVFAVGDCATLREHPHPKSGVYSVRHAKVLGANLRAALGDARRMRHYEPQRRALLLISCGRRRAIAQWGAWQAEGDWLWRMKDRIDRRFIARFQ